MGDIDPFESAVARIAQSAAIRTAVTSRRVWALLLMVAVVWSGPIATSLGLSPEDVLSILGSFGAPVGTVAAAVAVVATIVSEKAKNIAASAAKIKESAE